MKLNHFAVHLKLTQHCKSTILQYKVKIEKKRKKQRLQGSGQKNSGSQLEDASTSQRWDNLNIKKMTITDWKTYWQTYGYQRGRWRGGVN